MKLNEGTSSQVKLGDRKLQKVHGKGIIPVQKKGGNKKFIYDMLYVRGLAQNLCSVGQLLQQGYSVNFDNGECTILDKSDLVVAKVKMSLDSVFPLTMLLIRVLL